jgi:hypothetical protein
MEHAIINNGKVVNVVLADPEYASQQGWVPLPEGAGIGFSYVDGAFIDTRPTPEPAPTPPPPTKEELLAQLQALQEQINALE